STALAVAYLPWLFKHVVRSWFYGAKLTQYRGLTPNAELVAVSVLLHDLGLALVALRIDALRSWERTSVAPLPSRTIWGSAAQRQFGIRSPSTRPHRLRSIRAPTLPAVRTASHATTADSVTMS